MASNFPNTTDSFVNPQYTKVNGVDYVKAEHINDLQDAVRNIQLSIIGSGVSMNIASNNYVPETADIKTAIEILDGSIKDRENNFQSHLDAVMPTDPTQHHANVIEVTPIGNLASNKLQWALEELQNNIDMIMSGGFVEGITLDNRYLKSSGPAVVAGTLVSQGDFAANSNVFLGSNSSHLTQITGSLSVSRNVEIDGTLSLHGDLFLDQEMRIGLTSAIDYSHLVFDTNGVTLSSNNNIRFKLDSNDSIDGLSESSEFTVYNGSNSAIFSLGENGWLSLQTKLSSPIVEADSHIEVGTTEKTKIDYAQMEVENTSYVVKIDKGSVSINDFFAVTQNGDTGANNTSTDILMKAEESKFIAGNHVLKRGVQEVGYFGLKDYSVNAGGIFKGYGINFKSKMLTSPSSVTLNVDNSKSYNFNNLSITDINQYGFFLEADSQNVGHWEVKGTYETVGN